ncbi:MAG: YkgJ family cysteine cluster protein [Spirochaetota bacterium]
MLTEEYKKILDRAKAAKDINKKFLSALAKRKPPRLDRDVQAIHEEVFAEIDCMKCGNCCRTLGPRLTTADTGRISSLLKMRETAFVHQYMRIDEDDDLIFKTMPCPFVEDDNSCRIYDKKPKACTDYPHTDEKNIRLHHLSLNTLYCPAAFLIVEKMKEKYK